MKIKFKFNKTELRNIMFHSEIENFGLAENTIKCTGKLIYNLIKPVLAKLNNKLRNKIESIGEHTLKQYGFSFSLAEASAFFLWITLLIETNNIDDDYSLQLQQTIINTIHQKLI